MHAARMFLATVVAVAMISTFADVRSAEAGEWIHKKGPNFGDSYLVPQPVPAWVGHTNYTYQGLYPHHYLYPHYDVYKRYNGSRFPVNTTRIRYW
jgi:hypothetical protein